MGTTLFHNHKDRVYHIPDTVRETGNSKMNEKKFTIENKLRANSELTHKLINILYMLCTNILYMLIQVSIESCESMKDRK